MCIQGCQTFLWGGEGTPTHDEEGRCFCVCEDDSWSNTNILGRASCVPAKAHLIFGLVGLALSTVSVCQAAYHLHRQVKFHRENVLASTSTAERCRRRMHILLITSNTVGVVFFSMVLGHELRRSVVFLGVMQALTFPGAILAGRLWIYDTDPQHMNKSPPILALSNWCETPVGNWASAGVFAVLPAVAIYFHVVGHTEVGMKLAAWGGVVLGTGTAIVFWICGNSLQRVVDQALRHQLERSAAAGGEATAERGSKDTLVAVRKKATRMKNFVVQQNVMAVGVTLFVIFSPYGVAAPLLLFGIPMAIMLPFWSFVEIQMFAGRTKLRAPGRSQNGCSVTGYPSRMTMIAFRTRNAFFRGQRAAVVPTETMNAAPC